MSQNFPGPHPRPKTLALLSEAAAELAHDLNNALTTILGNLSIAMAGKGLPPELRDKLIASKVAGLRAQVLCQQLQNFADADCALPQPVALETLLREVLQLVRPSEFFKNEFVSQADLPPALLDPSKFGMAIEALLAFLHKLAPPESAFRFKLTTCADPGGPLPPGNYVELVIATDAPGFPPDQLPAVLTCKFRKSNKEAGFSLAASYALIHSQGGELEALPGSTAAFRIRIPASHPLAAASQDQSQSPTVSGDAADAGHTSASGLNILVLDDEPLICELLTCALETFGHRVVTVTEGAEALATYEQGMSSGHPFDIVFCDLSLPDLDGSEVCSRLRRMDPNARVVVCSGTARNPIVERFREYGFCAILPKPYDIEKLPGFLEKALSAPLP